MIFQDVEYKNEDEHKRVVAGEYAHKIKFLREEIREGRTRLEDNKGNVIYDNGAKIVELSEKLNELFPAEPAVRSTYFEIADTIENRKGGVENCLMKVEVLNTKRGADAKETREISILPKFVNRQNYIQGLKSDILPSKI